MRKQFIEVTSSHTGKSIYLSIDGITYVREIGHKTIVSQKSIIGHLGHHSGFSVDDTKTEIFALIEREQNK